MSARFQIYSSPKEMYKSMLKDIASAKKSIYLETYIYDDDIIGRQFRDALIKKAASGIKVRVLVDALGSSVKKPFFKKLIEQGGEVRFFKEFTYALKIFARNHERDHRKLLIVDRKIAHMGSENITASCLEWRELSIRLIGGIAGHLAVSFGKTWKRYEKISKEKIRRVIHEKFEILEDIPADLEQLTRNKYVTLIDKAKKEILIETPYFIPPFKIRKALKKAIRRGVTVKLIIPFISDVKIADLLRTRYLGKLHRKGVQIFYYLPQTLHSKLLIIDDSFFMLGSSNLDYRSFVHQYEINLIGEHTGIITALKKHFRETLSKCKPFSYAEWKKRSSFIKIIEAIFASIEMYV